MQLYRLVADGTQHRVLWEQRGKSPNPSTESNGFLDKVAPELSSSWKGEGEEDIPCIRHSDLKEHKRSRWRREKTVGFFWLPVLKRRQERKGVCKWMRKTVLCLDWGRVVVQGDCVLQGRVSQTNRDWRSRMERWEVVAAFPVCTECSAAITTIC